MRDSVWIKFDGYSPLFAERRKHSDIVSYLGLKPEMFDNWVYRTDAKPDDPMPHRDWEWQAFERGGWGR